jgi:8-amino-7-oxononanoate synthase
VSNKYAFLDRALSKREGNHRFRSLNVLHLSKDGTIVFKGGKRYINFSSNDYLGLTHHPKLIEQAYHYSKKYGAGSGASRLISGTYDIHTQLEEQLADTFSGESALVFNSGFQANSTILGTVTDRHSLILADKRSHNSLLQGALCSRAAFWRFRHNDTNHLRSLLQKAQQENYNRIWIVTESVFSMDGDRSPLDEISHLAEQFNALLFIDDAHAVGVWGEKGLGLARAIPNVDILLGTCGKTFGSFGAYVICSKRMKDFLINFCPGFIYTTALPPPVIGATQAALNMIPNMQQERKEYHQNARFFLESVRELGFNTGLSTTQIIPIIIGSDQRTITLAKWLQKQGFLATAIRPPTVPEEGSRIRITLLSSHTEKHLNKLINALQIWRNE